MDNKTQNVAEKTANQFTHEKISLLNRTLSTENTIVNDNDSFMKKVFNERLDHLISVCNSQKLQEKMKVIYYLFHRYNTGVCIIPKVIVLYYTSRITRP